MQLVQTPTILGSTSSCEILGRSSTIHFTFPEMHWHFHLTSPHKATQLMIKIFTFLELLCSQEF